MNLLMVILISSLDLVLVFLIVLLFKRYQYLRQNQVDLLQEKEIIFGFVHDIGEAFADIEKVEVEPLVNKVLFYAMRTTKASAGAIYLLESDRLLKVHALTGIFPPLVSQTTDLGLRHAVSKSQYVEEIVRSQYIHKGEGLIGEVADIGQAILIEDAERDHRVPIFEEIFLKIDSILLVPMRLRQSVLGVLVLVNRVDNSPFKQSDLNLVQALADQSSVSIYFAQTRELLDKKQRIDQDLHIARHIQRSLLPKQLPRIEGWEISAFNLPAQEVGGDYFDVIHIDKDHIGIAVADVSGKGVSGAIVMAICRSVLRGRAHNCLSPGEVLKHINKIMSQDLEEDMFVSMLYMILNIKTRELTLARAGHERPILYQGDEQAFTIIDSSGIAIGLGSEDMFQQVLDDISLTLNSGDILVIYTDGITEAINNNNEEWGLDNFIDAIRLVAEDSVHSILGNVRERVFRFVGKQPQYDDMTMVAIKAKN